MASQSPPTWTLGELPQPDGIEGIRRTFAGYKQALATMTIEQLVEQANLNAIALQAQMDATRERSLRQPDSTSTLNQPVLRTTPTRSTPVPSPRGQAALRSPQSPPPSSLDLLFGSRGRRLAAKLVASQARSISGRRTR